jgi:hypothetical protein
MANNIGVLSGSLLAFGVSLDQALHSLRVTETLMKAYPDSAYGASVIPIRLPPSMIQERPMPPAAHARPAPSVERAIVAAGHRSVVLPHDDDDRVGE